MRGQIIGSVILLIVILMGAPGMALEITDYSDVIGVNINAPVTTTETFLGLLDTPISYVGDGADCVKVNGAEDGLEFGSCTLGAGGGNTTEEMQDAVGGGFGGGITYIDSTNAFQHSDTSNQSSSDNSALTVIQDIILDSVGHLTSIVTVDVNATGDIIDWNWTGFIRDWSAEITGGGFATDQVNNNLNTTANVSFGNISVLNNFSVGKGFFIVDNSTGKVGINTPYAEMLDTLTVTDGFDLIHTSTEAGDHAFEIDFNSAGFGDNKAIDIDYVTGVLTAGKEDEVILININEFLATGGSVSGLEIVSTEGSAHIIGLEVGILVAPIEQLSGVFGDMDSASNNGVNALASFISTASDVSIFVADNNFVTIGDANKFEEIEFILSTEASGSGIKPTFEFSNGGGFTSFTPTDSTNGLRNSGVMLWLDSDIPTWATNGGEYLIKITRTANNLNTVPIEDKVQIAIATEYYWDNKGDLLVNNITTNKITAIDWSDVVGSNITNDLNWITNSTGYVIDWNWTGFIRDWRSEINDTGVLKNYNSTGLIKNYNATGKILNWSDVVSGSTLNDSGYIIDWNWTSFIRDWGSELGQHNGTVDTNTLYSESDWNSTTLIQNWNLTIFVNESQINDLNHNGTVDTNTLYSEADWNSTSLIVNWSEYISASGGNLTGLELNWSNVLNSTGYIIDWNWTTFIRDWGSELGQHNGTVDTNTLYSESDWNSTTLIQNWNLTIFVNESQINDLNHNGTVDTNTLYSESDWNSTFLIVNWSEYISASGGNLTGLELNWSNVINETGYVKNWNWTGYIINWNWTGFIRNWRSEINDTGIVGNYQDILNGTYRHESNSTFPEKINANGGLRLGGTLEGASQDGLGFNNIVTDNLNITQVLNFTTEGVITYYPNGCKLISNATGNIESC